MNAKPLHSRRNVAIKSYRKNQTKSLNKTLADPYSDSRKEYAYQIICITLFALNPLLVLSFIIKI